VVSLVCKAWQKVERDQPHQPHELRLKPWLAQLDATFIAWHLRDTRRLRAVGMGVPDYEFLTSTNFGESTLHLLNELCAKAPDLRSLELVPPPLYGHVSRFEDREAMPRPHDYQTLPLVGMLSQLECLTLNEWKYCREDICMLSHLSKLQRLKVPLYDLQRRGMIAGPKRIVEFHCPFAARPGC
jgi:hypothetical protein